jgi:hypothetical protein
LRIYKEFHPTSIESDTKSLESKESLKNNGVETFLSNNNNTDRVLKRKLMTYRYGKRSQQSFETNDEKLEHFIKDIKSKY